MAAKKFNPPQLVVIEGKEKGKVIALRPGTVVIGRAKGDVIIPDSRISRSHVALHFDDRTGKLTFTDLQSLNGTVVNGQPSEKGALADGDKLQLGNTLLDCHLLAATQMTESRPEPVFHNDEVTHLTSRKDLHAEAAAAAKPTKLKKGPSLLNGRVVISAYRGLRPRAKLTLVSVVVLMIFLSFMGGNSNSTRTSKARDGELTKIRGLAAEGKIEEALAHAEDLRRKAANDPDLLMTLGDLHSQHHSLETAIEAYKEAKAISPKPRFVHLKLTKAYLGAGLISLAQEEMRELDKQIQADPKDKEVLIETARLILNHQELNQPKDKVLIIAKALQNELATDSPIGYKLEAQQLLQQSRVADALNVLEKALKLAPTDEETLEKIVLAKLTMRSPASAMQTVEEWLKINPGAARAQLVLGYLKFNEKDYLGSLTVLQKLVKQLDSNQKDPFYAEALNLMGLSYLEQNQRPEAEAFLTKACALNYTQACSHPLITGEPSRQ